MNRLAGIIVAAAGLIIAVLSILKVVPGVTGAGVSLILFGGLIIGLSFVDPPPDEGTGRMSTAATLGNIFISPGEVFTNLRRHPRWLVAMLVMSALSATYGNLFLARLGPERVANYAIDKTLEMGMVRDNEDAKKRVEEGRPQAIADMKSPVVRAGQAISGMAWTFIGYSFLALIFFLFALAMGGTLNFRQAVSIAVYAGFPVAVVRFALNTLILYLKDPTDIHPLIGQSTLIQDNLNFLVLPSEHPVIFTILGSISLLTFYWMWMMATGLKNGGERLTGSIAWSTAVGVFVGLLLLGMTAAWLFPSFMS
jgi:hypothetical protein